MSKSRWYCLIKRVSLLAAVVGTPLATQAAIPLTNMALWLRADAEVETGGTPSGTIFTAGTPAADTDYVTAWRDQNGTLDAYPKDPSANADVDYEPRYYTTGGPNSQPYISFAFGPTFTEYARLGINSPLLTGTTDYSILAVVRFNSGITPLGEKVIAANYGLGDFSGVEFYHYNSQLIRYKNGAANASPSLIDNQWHLVQADRIGTTLNIYIDNQFAATGTSSSTNISGLRNWTIGNGTDYALTPLGDLAEQIVYSDDLSEADRLAAAVALKDKYDLDLVIVPEPASVALLGAGAWMILRRRANRS